MNTMPKMHTCFNTQPPEGGWARALACNAFRVLFQHTAARRRLAPTSNLSNWTNSFQHTAARRRLEAKIFVNFMSLMFQHTAARRRLGLRVGAVFISHGFNTQPPEGGWASILIMRPPVHCFNTQPPEGGWREFLDVRIHF